MEIVVISDTHGMHEQLIVPKGDVIIHAGDLTSHGTLENAAIFNNWLGSLPHKHKIVIAGNHDWCFEKTRQLSRRVMTNAIYLEDEPIVIGGIKFYGTPWQPEFYNWAFNLPRGPAMAGIWEDVHSDTDVLITHCPPYGVGDITIAGESVGCKNLQSELHRIKPQYHIFGHIHEGYGVYSDEKTTYINGSSCNINHHMVNLPVVFEIERKNQNE